MKRVLLLNGGWEGHEPGRIANSAAEHLLNQFEIVRSQDLGMLSDEHLAGFDLLVPIWTFGEITPSQESALLRAVGNGLGMVAWHGAASAFLRSRSHKFLLGGQFVAHPGGSHVTYPVRFLKSDPLVEGLKDFTVTSEQHYLLIDPAVEILASTRIVAQEMDWLAGTEMPVAWKRQWNKGHVFYCSLGHSLDIFEHPTLCTLLRRAALWAANAQ